jgi:hypothetical protein
VTKEKENPTAKNQPWRDGTSTGKNIKGEGKLQRKKSTSATSSHFYELDLHT